MGVRDGGLEVGAAGCLGFVRWAWSSGGDVPPGVPCSVMAYRRAASSCGGPAIWVGHGDAPAGGGGVGAGVVGAGSSSGSRRASASS